MITFGRGAFVDWFLYYSFTAGHWSDDLQAVDDLLNMIK